jgi:hypothetical protein
VRNATVANIKKPIKDDKSLKREPSTRTLKGNKSTLNITTDDASSTRGKTPGRELKRNGTVAILGNKTPSKPTPKTPTASDNKGDNSIFCLNYRNIKKKSNNRKA